MPYAIIPLLITTVFIALIVYGIVHWRRRAAPEVDPGIGTLRRLYFYIVSLTTLMMAATGATLIAQYLLEAVVESGTVARSSSILLATGIALIVVGLPLWIVHWRMVQRYVGEIAVERSSMLRKLYLYLVLGVALSLIAGSAISILQWAFRAEDFSAFPWAAVVIWGIVWAYHWWLESEEGQPTLETRGIRSLYLYLVAAATLGSALGGLSVVLYVVLLEAYDAVASTPVLVTSGAGLWRSSVQQGLSVLLVGGPVWAVHWLYFARLDRGGMLRQTYVLLLGKLGGAVAMLVAAGIVVYGVLTWVMGAPQNEPAAEHFRFLPGTLVTVMIGLAVWAYHGYVARREEMPESEGVGRVYGYIVSAAGVCLTVFSIVALSNAAIGTLAEPGRKILAGEELWQERFAIVITLALLGVPLWAWNWRAIQSRVLLRNPDEHVALVRRIFVVGFLAAGVLALVGSTSTAIFLFLRDALEAELSIDTLHDARAAIGFIAAAAVVVPYHWTVYRQDREAVPEERPAEVRHRRKAVTALTGPGGGAFLDALEAALGYRVVAAEWADPDARVPVTSSIDFDELAQRISDSPGDSILLVPDVTTVRVLSYF